MIQGDRILINEVRKYPFIYDQKHENYKDMKLKEETWNTIGATINVKRRSNLKKNLNTSKLRNEKETRLPDIGMLECNFFFR